MLTFFLKKMRDFLPKLFETACIHPFESTWEDLAFLGRPISHQLFEFRSSDNKFVKDEKLHLFCKIH